ncbi:MAG TPA: type II secretion system protein [Candidatus Acidoferrum sp.]|nr:type II secretion system protein [Candidatus Acidoferrum sp.]
MMKLPGIKKQAGFTIIEFSIAMGVTAIALAATMLAFMNATQANQNVTLREDIADNLRAGLNQMEQDLIQTGTGIPTGGITIPSAAPSGGCTAGYSNIGRPLLNASTYFPHCNVVLPAIEPGNALGVLITAPDATSLTPTDIITMMYQDNSLNLSQYPIHLAAGSGAPGTGGGCAGSISSTGASAQFDPACVVSPSPSGATINAGDLIMFSNANGNALAMVTSVAWPTVFFASGDPFGLNQTGLPNGTLVKLQNGGGGYPPTTAERVTMVSYYLDNVSVPGHVELIRRVNFNAGQTVGDTVENLQFTFNFNDGIATNQISVPTGYSENQIRSVNIYIGGRSDNVYMQNKQYIRTSTQTQVSLRSMAYFNNYH